MHRLPPMGRRLCSSSTPKWSSPLGVGLAVLRSMFLSTAPEAPYWRLDEVMTAIVTPLPASTMRSAFFKLGARRYLVISIAMVAVALDVVEGIVRDARIAVGACSAVAQRMRQAERRLIGAPASSDLGRSIEANDLAQLSPIDDVRASADYRRDAALTLLRRAIDACALGQTGGVV